jgi:hypothetical protein
LAGLNPFQLTPAKIRRKRLIQIRHNDEFDPVIGMPNPKRTSKVAGELEIEWLSQPQRQNGF